MYTVITENDESEWDDITGERYHFPKRYLKYLEPGTKVIYYTGKLTNKIFREKRLTDKPHYFGTAIIGDSTDDPLSTKNDYFCEILKFEKFERPVLAKNQNSYFEVIPENKKTNYWRDAVREINENIYLTITGKENSSPVMQDKRLPDLSDDYESKRKEGKKTYRYTAYYERDAKNRSDAIKIHGYTCMACTFNFEETYGKHGEKFIHVHHVKPVSEFDEARVIDPAKDLIVLCPNCHSMVHRNKKHTLSLDELKEILKDSA